MRISNFKETDVDKNGEAHSWRGKAECPKCGKKDQPISHCKDVGGTWIICSNCGLVDII